MPVCPKWRTGLPQNQACFSSYEARRAAVNAEGREINLGDVTQVHRRELLSQRTQRCSSSSPESVRRMLKNGRLPARQFGGPGAASDDAGKLEAWLDGRPESNPSIRDRTARGAAYPPEHARWTCPSPRLPGLRPHHPGNDGRFCSVSNATMTASQRQKRKSSGQGAHGSDLRLAAFGRLSGVFVSHR